MKMKMMNDANLENVNSKLTNGQLVKIWLLFDQIICDQIEEAE